MNNMRNKHEYMHKLGKIGPSHLLNANGDLSFLLLFVTLLGRAHSGKVSKKIHRSLLFLRNHLNPTSIPFHSVPSTSSLGLILMTCYTFFPQDLSSRNLQFDSCQASGHEWHWTSFPDVGLSYGNCHCWVFRAWHYRDTVDLLYIYQEKPDHLH